MSVAPSAIPYNYSHKVSVSPTLPELTKSEVIDEWKDLIETATYKSLIELDISETGKPLERLHSFIENYKEHFSIEITPVISDPIEDHIKIHFKDINDLVKDKKLNPFNADKIAEAVYLYDSVLPNLSEEIVKPKENEDLKLHILLIPEELFDWMFKVDYLFEKLIKKRVLDNDIFIEVEKNKDEFVKKALELEIFSPIPPKKLPKSTKLRWFRGVSWEKVHHHLYSMVTKKYLINAF